MSAGKASDVFVGPPAAARPGALLRSRPAALSGSRPKASGSAGGYLLPRRQLFVRSQQPWINDLSSIPKFDKMPAPLQDADARDLGVPLAPGNWRGVAAGPGIDAAERSRLVALAAALSQSIQWHNDLVQRGWIDAFLPDAAFGQFFAEEITKVRTALL